MRTAVFIYENKTWVEYPIYNVCAIDERLDEQLDSGTVQILYENSRSFADFSMVKLISNDNITSKEMYFYAFDTVEKRKDKYYIHTLELVEPTRLLMGVPIDGKAVTQPFEKTYKTSLYDALRELLKVAQLLSKDETQKFYIVEQNHPLYDRSVFLAMIDTLSPEFHWEAETLLWECLCDIGNVINCIPRLVPNKEETAFNTIIFEKINDVKGEYEI